MKKDNDMDKKSWKPKKHEPSEMEIACAFLNLRVQFMEENPQSPYPSDIELAKKYGNPV